MSTLTDKYINPLTDFGFKKLFGSEPNKALLIDFLNQVLPEHHKVHDLSYARNEHVGQTEVDRKAIFDLYCKTAEGETFIVELQKAKHNYFKDRSIFYASFPIQEQAKKGDWNYKLSPVYFVGILDFVFSEHKNDKDLVHYVNLKNQRCEVFYDKLQFIYIELPKFDKAVTELNSQIDKWLYVFRHLSRLQDRPALLQERVFQQLFQAAAIANFTKKERVAYEESLKAYRDLKGVLDTAWDEGRAEGRAEGHAEGAESRNLEIARQMKAEGEPIEKIIRYTGLSKSDLGKL